MDQYIIDLKVSVLFLFFGFISFSNCEIIMKVIVFSITVGYTARRWYFLEQNKSSQNDNK